MSPRGGSRCGDGPTLFDPAELLLRRTGEARLAEMARRGKAAIRSERERRQEENRRTMRRLSTQAKDLAERFELTYKVIEQERDGKNDWYGVCYEDGVIRIRLRHARTERLLKESSLVDTLCHELAHLRYMNHGVGFRRLFARILERARELGYYRPGPAEAPPRQRSLFDDGSCGIEGGQDAAPVR